MVRSYVTGEAAIREGVNRLLTKFAYPDVDTVGAAVVGGGAGGAPTVVVAASDATELSKSKADFVCTGVADDECINQAVDVGAGGAGGSLRVLLTEGTFTLDGPVLLKTGTMLQGLGWRTSRLLFTGPNTTAIDAATNMATDFEISHLQIQGTGTSTGRIGIDLAGSHINIHHVYFNNCTTAMSGDVEDFMFTANKLITMLTCYTGTLEQAMFVGNDLAGLVSMTSPAANVLFASNLMAGVGFDIGDGSEHVAITGNHWLSGTSANLGIIEGDGSGTGIFSVAVDNNTGDFSGFEGVILEGVTDLSLKGNTLNNLDAGFTLTDCPKAAVRDNELGGDDAGVNGYLGADGLRLVSCDGAQVTDNQIHKPGQNIDDTYDGIYIDSDRTFVTGNTIIPATGANLTRYGVNVAGGECNMVVGNDLRDPDDYGTDALNDAGANTQLFYPNDATYGDNFTDCGTGS